MGCTGSSSAANLSNNMLSNRKPSVWLIGGGPGSQKGKICDYLIRDYKFKYLSSYDMVQFQQQRGGPDAQLILKLFKQKKTMPSDLIVRLVKKAIASCGVRRFLIDGFPNSASDVNQFDKQLTSSQINFYGYIYIKISQQKMIASGIQAGSSDKTKSRSQIESNVRQIVKVYFSEYVKIKQIYVNKQKYYQINGEQGAQKSYQLIKSYLEDINIKQPKPVKVFFSHFDKQQHQIKMCEQLVKRYGLYFYTPKSLIEQALTKLNSPEGQSIKKLQKQDKQIPTNIVLMLIRKKIEKQDYHGNFLISGFPRSISDAKQWDKYFGWETQILGYITFQIPDSQFNKLFESKIKKIKSNIKPQQINKQLEHYQLNQKQICKYYQQKQMLLTINAQQQKKALKDVNKFLESKNLFSRRRISSKKLIFVSTLNGNGDICTQAAKKKGACIIQMEQLLQTKIKQNGLYSELIDSFIKIGKPVSGVISSRILLQAIQSQPSSNLILVNGFSNSEQQFQSWQQQIGDSIDLRLILTYSQNDKYIMQSTKQKIKNKKITVSEKDVVDLLKQSSSKMSQRLKQSSLFIYQINASESTETIQSIINKSCFQ